jgi:hypothetical protein
MSLSRPRWKKRREAEEETSPSDALKAVLEPLLELIEPGPKRVARIQNALDLGREAWNLHARSEEGGGLEAALDRASERLALPDVSAAEVRLVLQMLIERKLALFRGDDRVILDAVAVETPEGLQLKATWARLEKIH